MKKIAGSLLLCFILSACATKIEVVRTDKCQLRRTLKDDIFQFNFDLVVRFSKTANTLDESELNVEVNGVYLGKAVIAAQTEPIETEKYILPVRVTFPSSSLVITDGNLLKVEGYLLLNGKKQPVQFTQNDVRINNMTAL